MMSFTKPTAVFDATLPIQILPDVTKNREFTQFVATVNSLRHQLIEDTKLRAPLLEILLLLYTSDETKTKIQQLCPKLPIDADIVSFVDADILLTGPVLASDLDEPDFLGGGVGGSTFSGIDAVPQAEISILMPLIKQWINPVEGQSFGPHRTLSTFALCWFTTSVIIHEVMHCLIVWWGKGEYDTPEVDGIGNEVGSYVERSWYGGVTVAEFPDDRRGLLAEMISVGVKIEDHYYPIDRPTAAELLYMDTSQGLPMFHPQDPMPPSKNPSNILLKSSDAQRFTTSIVEKATKPSRTVIW